MYASKMPGTQRRCTCDGAPLCHGVGFGFIVCGKPQALANRPIHAHTPYTPKMRFYRYFGSKMHQKYDFINIFGQKCIKNTILYAFLVKNKPKMRFYTIFCPKIPQNAIFWKFLPIRPADRSTDRPADRSEPKKKGWSGGAEPPPAKNIFLFIFLNIFLNKYLFL